MIKTMRIPVMAVSLLALSGAAMAAPLTDADLMAKLAQDKPQEEPKKPETPKPAEPKPEAPKPEGEGKPAEGEKKKATADKKADTKKADAKKKPKKKPEFKKYEDVITKKAITKEGVFTTHLVGGKVYFQIPEDQFGREFVWQVKIAGIQTNKGTISSDSARQYVYFERIGNEIMLRARDYSVISREGEPETYVVKKTDLDAILAKMKIVTFHEKGEGDEKVKTPVIDVTAAFMGGIKGLEGMYKGKMNGKLSTIKEVKAFEQNIEARVLGKFSRKLGKTADDVTAEIRHSILALPTDLMKPRHYNHRVGFFDARYQDYTGTKNKVETKRYIKRWRLVKKNPELAVSEPVEPIIWYIDRGTPARYVEATREGIEFWQSAFEQAGFKNAIIAKMAPTVEEDPDWDPEDARYAVVRWVPSTIPNAQGPHVADPRTGEIIEADVRMYHNVIKLVEEWYFAQAGATDPRAKKLPLPDDVMSDLVRFVVAHEVGHSIGLHHNFIGSNAYTIRDLRNPEFVAKNGVASSIMDYARFNYVMQPEDGTSPIDYVAGPYDRFAIEWGYTEFPGDLTPEEEMVKLNKIADRQLTDAALRWDAYTPGSRWDPRNQTEDIGNDAMQATALGMKNLERIMNNLVDAASYEPGQTYDEVKVAYRALAGQFARELGHVAKYVGSSMYNNHLAQGQGNVDVYDSFPLEKQQEALDFIQENGFKLPAFWQNEEVLKRVGYAFYSETTNRMGERLLRSILSPTRIAHMVKQQAGGLEIYSPVKLFREVRTGLFAEAKSRDKTVTAYRRNLQSMFVNMLIAAIDPAPKRSAAPARGPVRIAPMSEDYKALARANLKSLQRDLNRAANSSNMAGIHFANLAAKIADALDGD